MNSENAHIELPNHPLLDLPLLIGNDNLLTRHAFFDVLGVELCLHDIRHDILLVLFEA